VKCLILGGTGAIGQHLVEILSEDDNKIYVTSRKEQVSRGILFLTVIHLIQQKK